jgi:hypothetical protein
MQQAHQVPRQTAKQVTADLLRAMFYLSIDSQRVRLVLETFVTQPFRKAAD